jgi:16S rRNA (cytidine1402-2'-O)-methyltransferase
VCRELTKLHEEVARGTVAELAEKFAEGARGEIVLVVAGAEPATASLDDAVPRVLALAASGARLKDAAQEVADATGLSRRELYEAALRAKP